MSPTTAAIGWDEFVARRRAVTDGRPRRARVASIGPDDPSDVVFTSGTTGSPKGVVMTHGQTLRAYLDWCDWADLRPGDRYLIANPFFHIFGYKAGCLACLMRGATIFPLAVFDAGVVLELVERERISVLPGPPTIYHSLLDHPDRATPRHLEPARRRHRRGRHPGRAHPARARRAAVRAHPHRLRAHRSGHGHRLPARRRLRAHRHDGRCPVARLRGSGRRPNRAPTSPTGEPGEVVVRGETVTRGYLDDPEATAAAIDADGWLHTGDLGTIDADGYLRIVGRIKDMFIVGGFNAYPAEIENLMLRHPAHRAGRGDRRARRAAGRSREGVRRAVSPAQPVEPAAIVEWARGEMANFKAPRSVEFLDELPVNATGKVVKDELRARDANEGAVDGASASARKACSRCPTDEPQLIGSRCTCVRHRHVSRAGLVPALRVDRDGRAPARPPRPVVGVDDARLPAAVAAVRGTERQGLRPVRRGLRRAPAR